MAEPIEQKIKDVIAEQLGINIEDIKNESKLVDDLGADSLDVVELIMTLEDKLSVEIPDEDIEKLRTFGDIVSYIKLKISN